MKKLIAAFVTLALFAGSAFAQTNVTVFGDITVRTELMSGDNRQWEGITDGDGRTQPNQTGDLYEGWIPQYGALAGEEFTLYRGVRSFTGSFFRGNIGVNINRDTPAGLFEGAFRIGLTAGNGALLGNESALVNRAWVGWRPNDMFNIRLGRDHGGLGGMGRQAFLVDSADIGIGGLGGGTADIFFPGNPHGLSVNVTPLGDNTVEVGFGLVPPAATRPDLGALLDGVGNEWMVEWDGSQWHIVDNPDYVSAGGGAAWDRAHPGNAAANVLGAIRARALYRMDGIGHFGIGYIGGGYTYLHGLFAGTGDDLTLHDGIVPHWDLGSLFAMANISMLRDIGLDLELGIRFDLGHTLLEDFNFTQPTDAADKIQDVNTQQLHIALGANYTVSPEFGARFRAYTRLRFAEYSPTEIGFDLLPFYHLNDTLSVFLLGGLRLTMFDHRTDRWIDADETYQHPLWVPAQRRIDNGFQWIVHPYVRINTGGPTFLAGFRIEGSNLRNPTGAAATAQAFDARPWDHTMNRGRNNNGTERRGANEYLVNWSVPIGMVFSF